MPGGCKGCCFRDFAQGLKTLSKRLGCGGAVEKILYVMAARGRIHYHYKQTNKHLFRDLGHDCPRAEFIHEQPYKLSRNSQLTIGANKLAYTTIRVVLAIGIKVTYHHFRSALTIYSSKSRNSEID